MAFELQGKFVRLVMVLAVASAVMCIHTSEAVAGTLRVCPSGCTYSSIQAAIDAVQTGDTITVAAGTYTENLLIDSQVAAKKLTMIGSGATRTIVDGSQGEDECTFEIDEGYTVSISDMTFEKGECPPAGGIFTDATVTLTRVTVTQNHGSEGGGGIAVDIDGIVTLNNCKVIENSALSQTSGMGGGILNFGEVSLVDTTVSGNLAPAQGGGIENQGQMQITNSRIINNTTNFLGGGIDIRKNNVLPGPSMLTISNSIISNNIAFTGGGFFNASGIVMMNSSTITNNSAGEGGGLENSYVATTTLTNSRVSRNTASTDAGGIANDRGTLTLIGCSVNDNQAVSSLGSKGGGVGIFGGTVEIRRSSITHNVASGPIGGLGGGIVITDAGSLALKHSQVTANRASTGGGGIYIFTGTVSGLDTSPVRGNQPDNCVNVPGC